jgi:hypothetical protein
MICGWNVGINESMCVCVCVCVCVWGAQIMVWKMCVVLIRYGYSDKKESNQLHFFQ